MAGCELTLYYDKDFKGAQFICSNDGGAAEKLCDFYEIGDAGRKGWFHDEASSLRCSCPVYDIPSQKKDLGCYRFKD